MDYQVVTAVGIFLVTYALIVSEKVHRTIVALLGGVLMVVTGILTQENAVHHIDFNTIGLLLGMMIIVGVTSETGLFSYLAIWAAKKVGGDPVKLLVALVFLTAVCSAFLDNVTTVLLTVPVTISICHKLQVKTMPYLISQILASNIGGTATLIGDPPNIMIGSAVKELSFMAFIQNLSFISLLILLATVGLLVLIYRSQLHTTEELKQELMQMDAAQELKDHTLLKKCLGILALTILLFFLHQILHLESATVALFGASLLLLLAKKEVEHQLEHIFHKVEWVALFFFVGLFIIVGALVETGVISYLAKEAMALTQGNLTATSLVILWMSAIASAFVDNIPFVATMIPMIKEMGVMGISNLEPLWWSLALGACLGGNGTLIGASANIIVAGLSAQEGQPISFIEYLKVGFPLMILSIIMSHIYIYLRYLM
ncbi:MAG: ArsB/NhaD family transporter [Sporomusaceae bacterium]|jgi:Na+/H+ antiporter NhaD/arsenite permease-like protein|nr:ArsB/NhaD family transporter [Sporomusaceae bacterium]